MFHDGGFDTKTLTNIIGKTQFRRKIVQFLMKLHTSIMDGNPRLEERIFETTVFVASRPFRYSSVTVMVLDRPASRCHCEFIV